MDEKLGRRINVGKHGYVELIDVLGDDARVVECARESYGMADVAMTDEKIKSFIKMLLKNGHTSPFEQVVYVFKIKLPIFVMRQLVRTRTARLNEISARYTTLKTEYFEIDDISKLLRGIDVNDETSLQVADAVQESMKNSFEVYNGNVDNGIIPKELVRGALPVSAYTECFWQIDANNMIKLLNLRLDKHAQKEYYRYAHAFYRLCKTVTPCIMNSFVTEVFNTVKINEHEINELIELLSDNVDSFTPERNKLLTKLHNKLDDIKKNDEFSKIICGETLLDA